MSILLLWKEGKLDLDDNIKKYLDEYINIETPITIRQMMNNVSGLRDQWELLFLRGIKINDQIDMDDINTTISLQKSLNFEPQSQYLYSNTGFHLLALIVEKLSQMSFPQFVKRTYFHSTRNDTFFCPRKLYRLFQILLTLTRTKVMIHSTTIH